MFNKNFSCGINFKIASRFFSVSVLKKVLIQRIYDKTNIGLKNHTY